MSAIHCAAGQGPGWSSSMTSSSDGPGTNSITRATHTSSLTCPFYVPPCAVGPTFVSRSFPDTTLCPNHCPYYAPTRLNGHPQ